MPKSKQMKIKFEEKNMNDDKSPVSMPELWYLERQCVRCAPNVGSIFFYSSYVFSLKIAQAKKHNLILSRFERYAVLMTMILTKSFSSPLSRLLFSSSIQDHEHVEFEHDDVHGDGHHDEINVLKDLNVAVQLVCSVIVKLRRFDHQT